MSLQSDRIHLKHPRGEMSTGIPSDLQERDQADPQDHCPGRLQILSQRGLSGPEWSVDIDRIS